MLGLLAAFLNTCSCGSPSVMLGIHILTMHKWFPFACFVGLKYYFSCSVNIYRTKEGAEPGAQQPCGWDLSVDFCWLGVLESKLPFHVSYRFLFSFLPPPLLFPGFTVCDCCPDHIPEHILSCCKTGGSKPQSPQLFLKCLCTENYWMHSWDLYSFILEYKSDKAGIRSLCT